jgi:uncharacterized repeat protein (TIGR01451 family)
LADPTKVPPAPKAAIPGRFSLPGNNFPAGAVGPLPPEVLLPGQRPAVTGEVPGVTKQGAADPPTPYVSIRVIAPNTIQPEKETGFRILVENRSQGAAHHVLVSIPRPPHASLVKADPQPNSDEPTLWRWRFGTLKPGDRKEIVLDLKPDGKGDVSIIGRVQFEHGQQVTSRLARPGLALKQIGPSSGLVNDLVDYKLEVTNTGDLDVTGVVVTDEAADGLEHQDGVKGADRVRKWDVGVLKAGQTRTIDYKVFVRKTGKHTSRASALAANGMRADTSWTLVVGEPQIDVRISGPQTTYLGYPAIYNVHVENTGTTPLDNVTVRVALPEGLQIRRMTVGGDKFGNEVQWIIRRLDQRPNGIRSFQLAFDAASSGARSIVASAISRGATKQAVCETRFDGAPVLRLDIRPSAVMSDKNGEISYAVTLRNSGNDRGTDVRLAVDYPIEYLEFAGATPTPEDAKSVIQFAKTTIDPRQTQQFTIRFKCKKPAQAHVRFVLTAAQLPTGPLVKEESVEIVDGN